MVGYSTVDAPAAGKFKAFSIQFENIDQNKEIKISELFNCDTPKGAANGGLATPDKIWLWDTAASDWVKYYYRKVGTSAAVGWCKNGTSTTTTDKIPAGEGFFFRRGTAGATDTITFTYGD